MVAGQVPINCPTLRGSH